MSSESENIQVFVRCRGRNAKETSAKSPVVVHVDDEEGDEVVVSPSDDMGITAQLNSKTYKFDRAFGPMADQKAVFKHVAAPLFDEFLKGYNCTLLVYGMTSTGKTYTMSGENKMVNGDPSDKAGIIPRLILKLFNVLEEAGDDYIVKCSFVELYNEELKDLLGDDSNKKLRIYDQKPDLAVPFPGSSKSAIQIQNLQEVILQDAPHGLKTLERGLKLRQVAATKMNDVSSRSHTIFTLSLFKQNRSTGDLFRLSKMNLVDLAGSENISRSGALNQRAKEAGSINQSLLTLGRVINLLVEKNNQHIPYRESKLTRLLQDSLGGQTKTCLIATVSPAKINYDETLSTLEYANKAKSIQNKPQLGLTLGRDLLLKEISAELARMKSDLSATRKKDGMYMDNDNYQEMMTDIQESKTARDEALREKEILKKQNDSLKLQIQESEAQSIQHITMINTLNTTIDSLHNKIDQQKENEKNLMSSSSKFKSIISTINDKIATLKTFEDETKAEVTNLINTQIKATVESVSAVLDDAAKLHGSSASVGELQSELGVISESFKTTTLDVFNRVQRVLEEFPGALGGFTARLADLTSVVAEFETVLDEQFSKLSRDNNQFKNVLTESLFQNHTSLVKGIVAETNQQIEDDANTLLNQFIDLLRENNNRQQSLVSEKIKLAVKKSMLSERKVLDSAQTAWDESTRGIINSCESHSKSVQQKYDGYVKDLSKQISSVHSLSKTSKTSVDEEFRRISSVIADLKNSKKIQESISNIQEDELIHTAILQSLSGTRSSIVDVEDLLNKNIVQKAGAEQFEPKDMNQMIKEIESEQAEIKKKLLATGKTPKREALKLPTQQIIFNGGRSPPKFQLIGQRFQSSENQMALQRKRKPDEDHDLPAVSRTKLPKLSRSMAHRRGDR